MGGLCSQRGYVVRYVLEMSLFSEKNVANCDVFKCREIASQFWLAVTSNMQSAFCSTIFFGLRFFVGYIRISFAT